LIAAASARTAVQTTCRAPAARDVVADARVPGSRRVTAAILRVFRAVAYILLARSLRRNYRRTLGAIPHWPAPIGRDRRPDVNDAKTTLGLKIVAIKKQKKWSWADIAAKLEHSPVWTCAACLGQMSMTEATAGKAGVLFDLSDDEIALLQEPPYRGSLPTAVPTDPLIYRFYELIQVYGTTWKELIQEEFGDGIMSAIDFDMTLERQPDQKGDRVKLTMSGKFLPYKRY
jgi:cyanate lyase